jgi:hypothetical protein
MSKGLDALESLETEYYTENNERILTFNANDKRLDTIEKELKAFDIIKKKEVDIFAFTHFIKCCNDKEALKEYNDGMFEPFQLTKEDFSLLKELLLY